ALARAIARELIASDVLASKNKYDQPLAREKKPTVLVAPSGSRDTPVVKGQTAQVRDRNQSDNFSSGFRSFRWGSPPDPAMEKVEERNNTVGYVIEGQPHEVLGTDSDV